MADTTPPDDAARKLPGALSSSVIEALASTSAASAGTSWNDFGVRPNAFGGTSTLTALASRNAFGPDSTAFTALADLGRHVFGPDAFGDTSTFSALADISRNALGDSTAFNALADIGRNAFGDSTALADISRHALGPNTFGDTSTFSALADISRNALGDSTAFNALADIGRNAFGDSTALADISRHALGDSTAFNALADIGRNAFGDSTALADISRNALGDSTFGDTSTLGDALGTKNYSPGISSFLDAAALKTIEGRIGAPWIKHLGGGGTYGSLFDDALSPTSPVEEISPSLEAVDVPGLSVSTLPVETNPPAPVYDGSDVLEPMRIFTKWLWDAEDFVAILVTMSFLSVVLLFHLQGLDWALPAVGVVAALLPALVLRDRR